MTTNRSVLNEFTVNGITYTQSINRIFNSTFITRVHDKKQMFSVNSHGYLFDQADNNIGRFCLRLDIWVFVGKNKQEFSFNSHNLNCTSLRFFQEFMKASK